LCLNFFEILLSSKYFVCSSLFLYVNRSFTTYYKATPLKFQYDHIFSLLLISDFISDFTKKLTKISTFSIPITIPHITHHIPTYHHIFHSILSLLFRGCFLPQFLCLLIFHYLAEKLYHY
jgi:hypothetical protein